MYSNWCLNENVTVDLQIDRKIELNIHYAHANGDFTESHI